MIAKQVWITVDKEKEQKKEALNAALIAVNGYVSWVTQEIGLVEIHIPIDNENQVNSDLSALEVILGQFGFKRMEETRKDTEQKDVM